MDFSGSLETHLTISLQQADEMPALRAFAAEHSLKCTHIVLDRGATPSQPMLTHQGEGTLQRALVTANELTRALSARGFSVLRTKIEAAPWNLGVPQQDGDVTETAAPADRYFEHHVKLVLSAAADLDALLQTALIHHSHVSRNALRVRADGQQERFVTQRCHRVGRATSRARLAALLRALRAERWAIAEVDEEYVIYDSNLCLDAGWIGV